MPLRFQVGVVKRGGLVKVWHAMVHVAARVEPAIVAIPAFVVGVYLA